MIVITTNFQLQSCCFYQSPRLHQCQMWRVRRTGGSEIEVHHAEIIQCEASYRQWRKVGDDFILPTSKFLESFGELAMCSGWIRGGSADVPHFHHSVANYNHWRCGDASKQYDVRAFFCQFNLIDQITKITRGIRCAIWLHCRACAFTFSLVF